jgi:hypothetical protein
MWEAPAAGLPDCRRRVRVQSAALREMDSLCRLDFGRVSWFRIGFDSKEESNLRPPPPDEPQLLE